jgi:alkylation response protein AidB-like acyl-CoA dehydrogenase
MFQSTEEQSLLRQAVGGYFRDHSGAAARAWSAAGWRGLADELGILTPPFPEELGGAGGTLTDAMIIMEMLGEHLMVRPYLDGIVMAGRAIAASASPRRAKLISAIGAGDVMVAVAWMETGSRDNPSHVELRAEPDGEGGFVLSGCKVMVRAAPWATHLIVSARVSGSSRDRDGIALFLVPGDARGMALEVTKTIDGYACADVALGGVAVGADDLIAAPGAGFAVLERMLAEGTAALCAEAIGMMRSMIAQTVAHAQQRKQFGKPLASFQVLQHRLVDMQIALEHATSIAHAAISVLEKDSVHGALLVSAAKYVVNGALNRVGRSAVQIHGAIGLMEETLISHYFRRATVLQSQGGGSAHHLSRMADEAGATVPEGEVDDIVSHLRGEESAAVAGFRNEVRAFLREALTPELRELAAWETGAFAKPNATRPWHALLAAKGWAAPAWPPEHGGPGWQPRQRQVFEEELARAGAPRLPAMGLQMAAPVLMRFGTPEQKARFLPRILSGEDYWCQGYSEPGAGSDLAAVQLQAVRDGDHYVLNGSKIWTTFAQYANWIFVLARTRQSEKRQEGISFIMVPMETPGITVRPLISMSGEHEVNQIFFDGVRVPLVNRVGAEHDGWRIAKYLLEFERGVGHQVQALVIELARLREIARGERVEEGVPLWQCAAFRRRYAELEARTLAIRLTEERLVYSLPAGRNVGDFTASLMKLSWSETAQEIDEMIVEALGPYAASDQEPAFRTRDPTQVFGPPYARTPIRRYLDNRVLTIAGGSSEVQRAILAKQMLAS